MESVESKHTSHFQQSVSQGAFPVINMGNDAEVPDSVHREFGQVHSILKSKTAEACTEQLYYSTPPKAMLHTWFSNCSLWFSGGDKQRATG